MIKIIAFMKSRDGLDAAAFQARALDQWGLALVAVHPDLRGFIINLPVKPPAGLPYRPPSDPTSGNLDAAPVYDVITEAWLDDAAAGDVLHRALVQAVGSDSGAIHAYRVTETVVLDKGPVPGRPSAGYKLLNRLMFHADMSDSAVKRSWGLHAKLAVKVHVGAARYVQNWVEAALDETCPQARGMAEMHFPSERDLVENFFDSPRGGEEILQDTAHFVAGGPRLYTIEHVLLPSPSFS